MGVEQLAKTSTTKPNASTFVSTHAPMIQSVSMTRISRPSASTLARATSAHETTSVSWKTTNRNVNVLYQRISARPRRAQIVAELYRGINYGTTFHVSTSNVQIVYVKFRFSSIFSRFHFLTRFLV